MRRSEFARAAADEFGPRADSLIRDLALGAFAGMTAAEALDAGVSPAKIWLALCDETDVPQSRRHGVGRLEPKH